MQEEFYIGWQAEAPPSFARIIRRFVIGLCVVIPVVVILITYFQHGFSSGTFEFGKTTELEGVYSEKPYPFLTIEKGKDTAGKPVLQKILLVGKGKFGFQKVVVDGSISDGQKIKMRGSLIYNDGKTAFEVKSIENQGVSSSQLTPSTVNLLSPTVQLRGEITDPKCLLGVMNPGWGKPHRDCAARCIAGGIPPVLKVANTNGETEYYLLADSDGSPLNDRILEYVGDGVQLCGRLEQDGDWLILYVDPATIRLVNKGVLAVDVMCNSHR